MASKSSSLLLLVLVEMLVSLGLASLTDYPEIGIPVPRIIHTPPLPPPAPSLTDYPKIGMPVPRIIHTPPLPPSTPSLTDYPEIGIPVPRIIHPPPVPPQSLGSKIYLEQISGMPRIPNVQVPEISGIQIPEVPTIDGVPVPEIPGEQNPEIPTIPGLPIPRAQIPTIPGVPIPRFPDVSGPQDIQECWASIINIGGCYAEIFRAFQSGQASFTVGPTCCKAVKDINSTCWPRMFPYNPFFPPLLQTYCSRYTNPLPAKPPTTDVPVPPVAPAPEEDSAIAPAPEEDAIFL